MKCPICYGPVETPTDYAADDQPICQDCVEKAERRVEEMTCRSGSWE